MQNKSVIQFIKITCLVVVVLILLDRSIGLVLHKMYFSQKSGVHFRTTYAIDSTYADIIILGSSRASHHYVSYLLEDSLGMTAYNAGRDGQNIYYYYALEKIIFKRYTPKLIILDLTANDLELNQTDLDRLAILLPYYSNHKEIHEILNFKSSYESYKINYSSIYPFNSLILSIVLNSFEKQSIAFNRGYEPLDYSIGSAESRTLNLNINPYDINKFKILQSFTENVRKAGCKLMVVTSPYFLKREATKTELYLRHFAKQESSIWLSYRIDTICKHPEYFADEFHLNNKGAIVFTNSITQAIKRMPGLSELTNKKLVSR